MAQEPREKPRLISSQAPGEPKVYYHQPVAEAEDEVDEEYLDDELQPQPVIQPVVHVHGPTWATLFSAFLVAQLVAGLVMALVFWAVYSLATANDDLECALESAERVQDGLPGLNCRQ